MQRLNFSLTLYAIDEAKSGYKNKLSIDGNTTWIYANIFAVVAFVFCLLRIDIVLVLALDDLHYVICHFVTSVVLVFNVVIFLRRKLGHLPAASKKQKIAEVTKYKFNFAFAHIFSLNLSAFIWLMQHVGIPFFLSVCESVSALYATFCLLPYILHVQGVPKKPDLF